MNTFHNDNCSVPGSWITIVVMVIMTSQQKFPDSGALVYDMHINLSCVPTIVPHVLWKVNETPQKIKKRIT